MPSLQLPSHGANYKTLYERLNIPMPTKVYDLSENVNALGFPPKVKEAWPYLLEKITAYPHPEAEPLKSMLASKHNVQRENILVGNGAAELLTFFANRFTDERVIIIHPTFSEYKATLEAARATIIELVTSNIETYELPMEQLKKQMIDASCVYICNPNNPTGSLTPKKTIVELLLYGKEVGCELLIDEAFMDWTDEKESVIPLIEKYPHLTVMRSMTKMYGIAGLRLGYMVSSGKIVSELNDLLPHWHVNALAIEVGKLCLEDESFRLISIQKQKHIKQQLESFLGEHGCCMTKSETNFLSFQLKDPSQTKEFYLHCLRKGVVLRHTENFIGMDGNWLRIGIKTEKIMEKFQQVMDEWYGK